MNNAELVYDAIFHFHSLGFQNAAYFQSSTRTQNFMDRSEAFFASCDRLNITYSTEFIIPLRPTLMGAYLDMKDYLNSNSSITFPPCAFSDNDTIALGAMKALVEAGYSIPADISIIGFDNIIFSAVNSPSLSTMQVNKTSIGEQAVRTLIQSIEQETFQNCKQFIGGSLILRESTK